MKNPMFANENGLWYGNDVLCKETMKHLEAACKAANNLAKQGHSLASRQWSDRAQNLRRVLVDFDVLPKSAL